MLKLVLILLLLANANLDMPLEVSVLAQDLRVASQLALSEAERLDREAPATDKIRILADASGTFAATPSRQNFRAVQLAYEEARTQVDRSASREVAVRFQWVEMLMAKMDHSVHLTDFTPGAALPPQEQRYTPEGLQALLREVHILANQIYVRSGEAPPEALETWRDLALVAAELKTDPSRYPALQEAWLEALPRFFALNPDERSYENYSLLLSNYVRLRAAFAQLYGKR